MGGFVGSQSQQRWWWQAIDHGPGPGIAEVFGGRKDQSFLEHTACLPPFGITRFDTEGWGPSVVIATLTSIRLDNNLRKRANATTLRGGHA